MRSHPKDSIFRLGEASIFAGYVRHRTILEGVVCVRNSRSHDF